MVRSLQALRRVDPTPPRTALPVLDRASTPLKRAWFGRGFRPRGGRGFPPPLFAVAHHFVYDQPAGASDYRADDNAVGLMRHLADSRTGAGAGSNQPRRVLHRVVIPAVRA